MVQVIYNTVKQNNIRYFIKMIELVKMDGRL